MTKSHLTMLAAILLVVLFVQLLGYWAAESMVPTPSNNLFGPLWTLLYFLMGVSLWLVWKKPNGSKNNAYFFFWGQLIFNCLWSFLFFRLQSPFLALLDIGLLLIFLIGTIVTFFKIDRLAGWLQIPYLLWVLFAITLNFSLWSLN